MTAPIVDHDYYRAHMDCDGVWEIRNREGRQFGGIVLYDATDAVNFVEALNWAHAWRTSREWRREQEEASYVRGKPNQ